MPGTSKPSEPEIKMLQPMATGRLGACENATHATAMKPVDAGEELEHQTGVARA